MEFGNPYLEKRKKSQGELAQEYAALFEMALLLFNLKFTDNEKRAIPVVIGALLRERKNLDLDKLLNMVKGVIPNDR
jgi:hypothetical protein